MSPSLRNLFLLPATIVATVISYAESQTIEPREDSNAPIPAPIYIAPDQSWGGIDGSWSTFTLRVGTPPQLVRTLVSFKSYQTWVVLPEGCQAAENETACAEQRGSLFNETASSSFDRIGIYDLGIEQNLGLDGNAIFGYDVVGLGSQNDDGPTLPNATVGGLAVTDLYLGVFGVNPKPSNFTSFNDGSPSYMTQLKEQNYIPSVSFGYTAGATYRFSSGVPASLVLGGYDDSQFIENNLTFTFAGDNSRDLVVGIQSITTPSQIENSPTATELLPASIYAYIDSTVSEIWLPQIACLAFELEFGLVYDNTTGLYLVNDTLHESLLDRNASVTFTLGQVLDGGDTINVVMPYAAFDLEAQASYTGLSDSSRYFPLQRAQNDTQYTLGRAFMQEAYVSVDWESQIFNVSQVNWVESPVQHLVPIIPGDEAGESSDSGSEGSNDQPYSSSTPSAGVIAGIAVGVIAALAILGIGLMFWWRRKKQSRKTTDSEKSNNTSATAVTAGNVYPKAELEGSTSHHTADHRRLLSANSANTSSLPGTPHSNSNRGYFSYINGHSQPTTPGAGEGTHSSTQSSNPFSPISDSGPSEADSRERQLYEMPGDMPEIREKDGKALSEKEALQHRERVYNGVEFAPNSSTEVNSERQPPRRVNPGEVVVGNEIVPPPPNTPVEYGPRRAFSFELEPETNNEEDLYV